MSSVVCPHFLEHSDMVHDPVVAIHFTVGIFLLDSLIAHLRCHEGDFWWLF